ncbi:MULTISPECIES: 2Fe-2S iron-sulfur cluster-binding protein [Sphingomonadales]|uniref:Putidaredoxin n=1 Tax=Edaphosphingomonas haloaromaticamans TaxID=653954 RepID=A0A1S1HGM4_9SPHN|nr:MULTISPECIES: 2Fe-2S iron-sulfur cluster-binding protein [Sphingomonas]AGH48699.1 ferredoxin [Sphingomonas sp. MM-1]OHT21188.1 Putidaredoxin [Sphingomonas haloaromaticamans]
MITINVTTRDGDRQQIDGQEGSALMEMLRDAGLGVDGTCGGMCSCGSCHVYIASETTLPKPSEDEADMLEGMGSIVEVRPSSRLSCQIILKPELDGLEVEIAPQF